MQVSTQVLQQIRKLGLAAAIAAFAYQPAMQASSQRFVQPSPTAPMIDTLGIDTLGIDTLVAAAPASESLQAGAKQVVRSAAFVRAVHPTAGNAQIVEADGQRYLELDANFRSNAGPDLFVLLHSEAVPESYSPEAYVNLGRLQEFEGAQRYAIPAEVDLASVQSVVIWCEDFNVTFGYATL